MLWQVHLQTDRPSLRREEFFLSLRFEAEDGTTFTSNSVALEMLLPVWEKIRLGLERHYRDRLSILRNRLAPVLEDLFHPFFPNPASYGKGFAQIFDAEGHELLFTVSEPRWFWFPLELLYTNQQFLGLRHCVARQSVPIHELATRGVLPPSANQEIWALAGDADAGAGLWAEQAQLEFSARQAGEQLSLACENQFSRPASESWVAKLLPGNGHIYFIGHCRPGQDGVEAGFFLLQRWHSPRELMSQPQFKPSLLFLNGCHSAAMPAPKGQSGAPESFPELIARKKIPLFAGHISRLTPELAAEAADIFFTEFYGRKKSLSEAWLAARGAKSSVQLKDGSASLLGYQLYAPHPRMRLLERTEQASMHRLELAPLRQQTEFKKIGPKRRNPIYAQMLPLIMLFLLGLTVFLLFTQSESDEAPPAAGAARAIKISKSGHPVLKSGIVHYTQPWLIEKETRLSINDKLTSGNILVFEQDVKIAPEGTLLIDPGLKLCFQPEARLLVHGKLEAVGTKDAPVIFTSAARGEAGRWPGIFIGPEYREGASPQAYFESCIFSNGKGVPLSAKPVQPDEGQNWFDNDQLSVPVFGKAYAAGSVNRRGGAVLVWRCRPQFVSCRFENNRAWMGGALYLRNVTSSVDLYDCEFVNNSANRVGGALFLVDVNLRINDCLFEQCGAESAGGAITVFRDSRMSMRNTILRGNRAGVSGGALYFYTNLRESSDTLSTHRLEGCQFEQNSAGRDGGALSFDGACGNLEGRQLKFSGNRLSGEMDEMEGGAIFFNPRSTPTAPLRISLRSIRLTGNSIDWNAGYAAKNQGPIISRGSAVYFGKLEHVVLDFSNWIVQENLDFTSEIPLVTDPEIDPEAKTKIDAILQDTERVKDNRRVTTGQPAL